MHVVIQVNAEQANEREREKGWEFKIEKVVSMPKMARNTTKPVNYIWMKFSRKNTKKKYFLMPPEKKNYKENLFH